MLPSPVRRAALWYAAAALAALAAAAWVLQLWRADLRVPFVYLADGRAMTVFVHGLLENGWYLHHPRIGAPGELHLADYPVSDACHFLILKLLGLAVRDTGVTVNLFFLLSFPLAAVSALFVLRRLGTSFPSAFVACVLYALLPYHFLRGVNHLLLSAYYLVPLAVLVAVRLCTGEPLLVRRQDGRWRLDGSRSTWGAVAVVLLLTAGGIYYAFFTCGLLAAAALAAALRRRAWQPLAAGGVLVALIVAGTLANLAPTLICHRTHGPNPAAAHSAAEGGEILGLKLAQLVLPVTGHRIRLLAALKARYNAAAPLVNENDCATLGLVGSLGFVCLLGRILLRRRPASSVPDALAVLNLAALLIGTVGGLGALFSFYLLPAIRGYNRISIFIAFFALAAVAGMLDRLATRAAASPRGRWAVATLLALVLAFGLFDQTSRSFAPDHRAQQAASAEDAAFVAALEARLPAGAAVFQLPYVPFPEHPPVGAMVDYDHLRGYLHSRTLRWSYGAMKGRPADAWQARTARLPVSELLPTLTGAGFRGLYLDRAGYADQARSLVRELEQAGLGEPVHSTSGRLLFWDLADTPFPLHAARTDAATPPAPSPQ